MTRFSNLAVPRRALIGFIIIVALIAGAFLVMRVRGAQRSGWLVSKHLSLAPVVKGLTEPTYIVSWPSATTRDGYLVALERGGKMRVADRSGQVRLTPLLDLSQTVSTSTEQGLLGLAFDPRFASTGFLYVSYTDLDNTVRVVRYTATPAGPPAIDPTTAHPILDIPKTQKYHNGGTLAFGPDGYLYISIGDDERADRAQDLGALTGKILRIDVVSADPYAVPPDNPFVSSDARGEIWAYGLRNPWRFSFDRRSGDMWIGDVHHVDREMGQDRESVEFQPAGRAGLNYGFPMESTFHCVDLDSCRPEGVTLPVADYSHNMNCSVTGGYVYRGSAVPALVGTYVFGDLCTGGVFALRPGADGGWSPRLELGFQPIKISSFGEDADGELYVVDYQGGVIYRIADGSLP